MSKKINRAKLKKFVRKNATAFLDDNNITSVGIAYKETKGTTTKELCVQFTVGEKVALEGLESLDSKAIPEQFEIDGVTIPTDVKERRYEHDAVMVSALEKVQRKKRMDPILPGASIGHPKISAGTAGCVVYDANTGQELLLSNWHVLHGNDGKVGDAIVQPGRHDDNRVGQNIVGKLINSHLGLAGDCAIAEIDSRQLDDTIMGLNTSVKQIADVELDDKVIKSGRTTAVTRGIVSRTDITAKLNYGSVGIKQIGCFEYEPDPDHLPHDGEISMGGDSGSAVLLVKNNKASSIMVGLHFAGEVGDAREHGLACYASSVFKKLNLVPSKAEVRGLEAMNLGYDRNFLSVAIKPPEAKNKTVQNSLLKVNGQHEIEYMHFSLAMHKRRKFASWVAWNIDGGSIKKISRKGIPFTKDPDFRSGQIGNELYKSNPLDRGHIARRAELCWGTMAEAKKANKDSFYFSNMVPQHERFNQSKKAGIWGGLENAIFDGALIEQLKVSVFGGPIFDDKNDPEYRDVKIPKAFWKVVWYVDEETKELQHHAFILTQADLISGLEALDLDEFEVYKVPLHVVSEKTGFNFVDVSTLSGRESLATEEISIVTSLDTVLG
ncbi:DNA/RNA non-specific endonuclease [Flagellimonas sp. DF-77]|uniref:DNA/RNA non-specific endonuclease n=1 Tax=Flagellimonas algarum TaxID=3230298 RepID=UPI003391324D